MHHIRFVQKLPISLEEAWAFFSSPKNLAVITPKELNLVPLTEMPDEMYPGIFIQYSVKPLLGIPLTWVTEITHVKTQAYFIDEQRSGPYRIWHHEHHFKSIEGGVEMTDILNYQVPYGALGRLMNALVVSNQVKGIFDFREKRLIELFGNMPE